MRKTMLAVLVAAMAACGGDKDPSEPIDVGNGDYWDRGCVEGALTGATCDAFSVEEGQTIMDCQVFDFDGELGCCLAGEVGTADRLWAYCQ